MHVYDTNFLEAILKTKKMYMEITFWGIRRIFLIYGRIWIGLSIMYLQIRHIKIIISLSIIWRFILKFVAYVSLQYQLHSDNIEL